KLALVMVVTAGAATLAARAVHDEDERARIALTAGQLLEEGRRAIALEDFATASARFEEVARMTSRRGELDDLHRSAMREKARARESGDVRAGVDLFSIRAGLLRPRLIGSEGHPG